MEVKPLEGLTRRLQVLLKFSIAITVIAVLTGFFEYHTYKNLPPDFDINVDLLPSDTLSGIVGLIQIVLFIFWELLFYGGFTEQIKT